MWLLSRVEHKVSVYCHVTSLKGAVGAGGGGWWSVIKRFWSSHYMWSKVSAGCPSPATTHWCKSFISLVSAINLSWFAVYQGFWDVLLLLVLPGQYVASELWVLLLMISACSGSSVRISMPLSRRPACASMVGSHSVHFICGSVSLISVSDLP